MPRTLLRLLLAVTSAIAALALAPSSADAAPNQIRDWTTNPGYIPLDLARRTRWQPLVHVRGHRLDQPVQPHLRGGHPVHGVGRPEPGQRRRWARRQPLVHQHPGTGEQRAFPTPVTDRPDDIVVGPGGNLWYIGGYNNRIARFEIPRCGGQIARVQIAEGDDPTAGPDVIVGTGGADHINGLGGDDIVCGGGGVDVLTGAAGEDLLIGQAGRDRLYGNTHDDQLRGGLGHDACYGGPGADSATTCEVRNQVP